MQTLFEHSACLPLPLVIMNTLLEQSHVISSYVTTYLYISYTTPILVCFICIIIIIIISPPPCSESMYGDRPWAYTMYYMVHAEANLTLHVCVGFSTYLDVQVQ